MLSPAGWPYSIQKNGVIVRYLLNSSPTMSLKKLIKFVVLTLCVGAASYAIVEAQTGNTGGSSGGTGGGQSGTGSGPAATSPSTGGASFSGDPDTNPYERKPVDITTQTTTTHSARKRTTRTAKSSTTKSKKQSKSASPSASTTPTASR